MKIPSYPKIYNLGHAAIRNLFNGPVIVQEKYDGSQISWAWFDGELHVRSKGKMQYEPGMVLDDVDKGFVGAVEHLLTRGSRDNIIYRGEWFKGPRQNTLTYDDRPLNGIVLYDVEIAESSFVPVEYLEEWATTMQVSPARHMATYYEGATLAEIEKFLEYESTLGGPNVEGVVIKNYEQFTRDGKVMMGKLVSPAFREKHSRSWKTRNPSQTDILDTLIEALNTEARWQKAYQFLRDDGQIEDSPRDIGPLMRRIKQDTIEEEREWIAERLAEYFLPKIERAVGRGAPEWYKDKLAEKQFKSFRDEYFPMHEAGGE